MQTKNVKEEIIEILLNGIVVSSNSSLEDNPTSRYCKSLDLLLTKENATKKNEFVKNYCVLIQKKGFPLLKVYTVVLLYQKWLAYPQIVKQLDLLFTKSKMKLVEDEFWLQIIVSSESDKKKHSLQQARLKLLLIALNSNLFNQNELVTRGEVINSILRLHINEENQNNLKSGLKDKTHPYFRMFYIIRKMVDMNLAKFELSELLKTHFWSPDKELPWDDTLKRFHDSLASKSVMYLNCLTNFELKKLYSIYEIRPVLFDEINVDKNKPFTFKLLLNALFENFMISGVFLKSFYQDKMNVSEKEWFFDEIKGKNIVNSTTLPFKLTKKAAHHFRNLTPELNISISEGLVYSSLFTLTEDHDYSLAVARAIRDIYQADYWIQTMSMLHKKGLIAHYVIMIMDYLNEKVIINGISLDLKNKNIKNLLKDMNEWHVQLRTARELKLIRNRKLADAGIKDFATTIENKTFIIKQLKSSIELFDEGNDLCHCVYSYRNYCWNGSSYIFSLRQLDENEIEKRLITIEVKKERVCQTRGKFNSTPTDHEKEIISIWSKENNLAG